MEIDNLEETMNLLNNIDYFFNKVEEINKKLLNDLVNKELERDDLLHEIELSKLNAIEIGKVYRRLEQVLKERRVIKNKLELINTIKPFCKKYIEKGICADTKTTIKNIETLKKNNENKQYTPRIIKDLKCAKTSKKAID